MIDEEKINNIINETKNPSKKIIHEILEKSKNKKGLTLREVGFLLNVENEELIESIFKTAEKIKDEIYGERLVLFAPLYISSYCINDCEYCGFHCRNKSVRKKLSIEEVKNQTEILERMGHKRLLLEFGEDPNENPIEYVVDVIKAIYDTRTEGGNGEIRRVNVNIAATSVENYRKLKNAGIGTYQLFQETYHKETYEKMHNGPKADYERQLFAHDRAIEAGLDDVGLGVLFGLYDYKFEVLSLIDHAQYLDEKYNIGPHTFSVPRWQPAVTVKWEEAPYLVNEKDLLKIIAILRVAVPYTGMIISTRESKETRKKAFKVGISQTSAASRTSPGGYGKSKELSQFTIADDRPLDQNVKSILEQGLLPSFCTACYRVGRTGEFFMQLAKSGNIRNLCRPNALLTFKEYLEDYAPEEIIILGEKVIEKFLAQIPDEKIKNQTKEKLSRVKYGERGIYF